MVVLEDAINTALVREESRVQHPIYYMSKRLLGAESRYPMMEKLTICLMVASRRLRPHFQAHPIKVLTNHPLRQVLQKPESSGRLLKWSVELSQIDITYHLRISIKGQALIDFIIECTPVFGVAWKLFVDGSSNKNGTGAGLILVSPEGHRVHSALRFGFSASNNEAEYKALIAGHHMALELKAEGVEIFSDSQLVVNQVLGDTAGENSNADALAKLATTKDAELINVVPIDYLESPSISDSDEVESIEPQIGWMEPIVKYLVSGELPQEKKVAQKLLYQVPRKIVSENGWQFNSEVFTEFCQRYGVIKNFSSVAHPQGNGQVEAVNKTLKSTLKKRLEQAKGAWPEELLGALWSYRTTARTSTGHSPFSMAYGYEAMLPVEAVISTHRRDTCDPTTNHALLQESLDLIEELREASHLRVASHQHKLCKSTCLPTQVIAD
ncbi:uncharacterized protein LOC133792083 [Humulus lupulus]|uniref:uncharacterized protein LOC133792083 n=1 Tax=Humulus lupulus TaxID=3486 RepID=UPI002B40D2A5|nr:uncharacterized protein LOC133792083 [Humulus lupulus]